MLFENKTKANIADNVNAIGCQMDGLTAQIFLIAETMIECAEKNALDGSAYLASTIKKNIDELAQSLYEEHRCENEQAMRETKTSIELVKMLCEAKGEQYNTEALNHYRLQAYEKAIGADLSELKDDAREQRSESGYTLKPGELPPF